MRHFRRHADGLAQRWVRMNHLTDIDRVGVHLDRIGDAKMGDVNVLDILPLEAGAFYIMDRG